MMDHMSSPTAGELVAIFVLSVSACVTLSYLFHGLGYKKGYADGLKFKNWFQGRNQEEQTPTQGGIGQLLSAQGIQNAQGPSQQQIDAINQQLQLQAPQAYAALKTQQAYAALKAQMNQKP